MPVRLRWIGAGFVVSAVLFASTIRAREAQVGPVAPRPGMMTAPRVAPPPEPPLPPGRDVFAADGDRIIVPADARVQMVSRYEGQVRVVTDPTRMVLVVLVDIQSDRRTPDGIVDWRFRFKLDTPFPLGDAWEGPATIEDTRPMSSRRGRFSLRGAGRAFDVMAGLVDPNAPDAADGILRVSSLGSSAGMESAPFDVAETAAFADAPARMPATYPSPPRMPQSPGAPGGTVSSSLTTIVGPTSGTVGMGSLTGGLGRVPPPPPSGGPVRVGGPIKSPTKIVDVRPVMPDIAREAGIRGVVILELSVDPTGAVADARVLRSIPLLDAAALEAVKQWKYLPTLFNGVPVPIILTATVNFP